MRGDEFCSTSPHDHSLCKFGNQKRLWLWPILHEISIGQWKWEKKRGVEFCSHSSFSRSKIFSLWKFTTRKRDRISISVITDIYGYGNENQGISLLLFLCSFNGIFFIQKKKDNKYGVYICGRFCTNERSKFALALLMAIEQLCYRA